MNKIGLFKNMYFQHFCSSGRFFVFLATKLRQACQKFLVHVQANNLTNKFFGKLINFSSFPHFEQKFSEVWREICGRVVTTAFCVSTWRFFSISEGRKWGKFFSKKLHCHHFQTFNEKYTHCPLQAWLRQACQKMVVHVQSNIFTNRFFAQLIFFSSFPEFQQKVFNVLTRNFWQDGHN